jgi:glycosyltransferase involved in cell wall biosynthesis
VRLGVVMPIAEQRGGAEQMLVSLLREAQAGDTEFCVAFLQRGQMVAQIAELGHPVQVISAGRVREVHRWVPTVVRLAHWIRSMRLDGVLAWMAKAHLYSGPAAALTGTQAVWFQHELALPGRRIGQGIRLMPTCEVWCCSRASAEAMRRLCPSQRTRVIRPAIDLRRFDPSSLPTARLARRRLGLDADAPLVGMVTRLQRWKGVHVLVAAAEELVRSHPTVRFVVVGGEHWSEPGYGAQLRSQLSGRLRPRFDFVGHREDVPLWMQAMDVVVSASYNEPAGITVLEAMSLGKVVVAADSGGPMEVVHERVNGRTFRTGDAGDLARVILEVVTEPAAREHLSRVARQTAIQEFSATRLALEVTAAARSLFA